MVYSNNKGTLIVKDNFVWLKKEISVMVWEKNLDFIVLKSEWKQYTWFFFDDGVVKKRMVWDILP